MSWVQRFTEEGHTYYENLTTGESQWAKPSREGVEPLRPPSPQPGAASDLSVDNDGDNESDEEDVPSQPFPRSPPESVANPTTSRADLDGDVDQGVDFDTPDSVTRDLGRSTASQAKKRRLFKKNSSVMSSFTGNENMWVEHRCSVGENAGQSYFHQPSTGESTWIRPTDGEEIVVGDAYKERDNDDKVAGKGAALWRTLSMRRTSSLVSFSMPSSTTPPPTRMNHVTECATVYSVLMACITTSYTALYAYYARTGDEKVAKFWTWIIIPMSSTAVGISFALKPRREDRAYKVFLVLQYVLFSFVSEILTVVGYDFTTSQIIKSTVRSVLWLALFKFGMKSRSRIARLSDEDLSKFLTNDVTMGGMLVGLGQLAFLMFASIQCDGKTDDWRQCSRTLLSQAGLSGMVTLFTVIKLLSGVVPKRILERHVISPKKVLAMDLNAEEAVQFFGLLIAAGCALYPLGNYGAEGDFHNNADGKAEKNAAFIVPIIGAFCLLLTAVWKMVVIRGEMRREAEETGQLHQGESSSDGSLVEASSFWFYVGVLATTYFSAVNVAVAVTMGESYKSLSTASLPIVILLYGASLFCQPRRRSPKDMWMLRLHFISYAFTGEMAFVVYAFKQGGLGRVIMHFTRLAAQALGFHFVLKLRAAVGRLPDKDLEMFLVDRLFKGGFQTLFSILFLTFRTTKCMFEKGSVAECGYTSQCSTMISVYLVLWWVTKLVQGSVRSEWRNELNLSMENIARIRDISLRRGAVGFLTLVTGICGIFLFSMMSADELDETTITVVGLTGVAASGGILISEIFSSLKEQRRIRELRESDSGQVVERSTEIEEPVEECSWFFVCVSFLFTSVYSMLYICYCVTLEDWTILVANLILPIVILSFVMAVVLKPKRSDAGYKRFLYFHFFTFTVFSEVGGAVGNFRLGLSSNGLICIFRIPFECLAFWLGLKLRASAAKLPHQELSDFLCQTVLVKGTAAMGTMFFFSFETVACFIGQNSIDNGKCEITSLAAMYLSVYLALLAALSIFSKAVPKRVQGVMAVELSSIASLKGLRWWQQIQGGLMTITAISSLYLLSVLGVEGNGNDMVWNVGFMGLLSIGIAADINMIMLVRARNEHQQNTTEHQQNTTENTTFELLTKQRSIRAISSGQVEEGMFAAAMI